jgi:hypothetical protein
MTARDRPRDGQGQGRDRRGREQGARTATERVDRISGHRRRALYTPADDRARDGRGDGRTGNDQGQIGDRAIAARGRALTCRHRAGQGATDGDDGGARRGAERKRHDRDHCEEGETQSHARGASESVARALRSKIGRRAGAGSQTAPRGQVPGAALIAIGGDQSRPTGWRARWRPRAARVSGTPRRSSPATSPSASRAGRGAVASASARSPAGQGRRG